MAYALIILFVLFALVIRANILHTPVDGYTSEE